MPKWKRTFRASMGFKCYRYTILNLILHGTIITNKYVLFTIAYISKYIKFVNFLTKDKNLPTPGTGAGTVYHTELIFDLAPSSISALPSAPFCKTYT